MSGTSGSLATSTGGITLPAPVLRRASSLLAPPALYIEEAGAATQVNTLSIVTASVHGFPDEIMQNLAQYQPQLELLRYVPRRTREPFRNRSIVGGGYVHPSHGPAASGNGHHTHGGVHTKTAAVMAIRPTEWAVMNWGQVIDVTQGMFGFMRGMFIQYRDPTGNGATLWATTAAPQKAVIGTRFPYSSAFRPGYYRFRWSIIDPSDARGQRISGPLSDTVSVSTAVFPFSPAPPIGGGATATVVATFNHRLLNTWLGSVSRLPT